MRGRCRVTVGFEGKGDRAVPEHLLNDLRVDAAGQQERRRRVPQIVNPKIRNAGSRYCSMEAFVDIAALERAPDLRGEHQVVLLPDLAGPEPLLCLDASLVPRER